MSGILVKLNELDPYRPIICIVVSYSQATNMSFMSLLVRSTEPWLCGRRGLHRLKSDYFTDLLMHEIITSVR